MLTLSEFENCKATYDEIGGFQLDVSRNEYWIFSNSGLAVFRKFKTGWFSKCVGMWHTKSYADIKAELQTQQYNPAG